MIDYEKELRHLGMKKSLLDRTLWVIIAVLISPLLQNIFFLVMAPTIFLLLIFIALIIYREWKFESDRLARYERGRRYELEWHIG